MTDPSSVGTDITYPPIPQLTHSAQRSFLQLPADLLLEEWAKLGEQIFFVWDASGWWLGDWLMYGQSKYPDRYRIALEGTPLSYQTLRNYAWVARHFPVKRRRKDLSFQHHSEVVSLAPEEQDQWLDRASRFGWSRNELRRRLKAAAQSTAPAPTPEAQIQMKVTSERKTLWEKAAASAGQDLATWMVSVLDASAGDSLEGPPDSDVVPELSTDGSARDQLD
ncbi:LmbU family transcriptional regulator [Spiractinospora alimapuensis]|uniref:LmbU family transcriptional regulator n=1 Tax=Spiractinospora alimapuensis TaxID=2820884 RepID=UPI001F3B143D|nr:LmbU family transcriptional regulator [Spiractinospora alimapuensis]QVQ51821.1 LmbU family transcriptional regulator [Spiractinospora alimapuensis]